jgi:hypothetical protein
VERCDRALGTPAEWSPQPAEIQKARDARPEPRGVTPMDTADTQRLPNGMDHGMTSRTAVFGQR